MCCQLSQEVYDVMKTYTGKYFAAPLFNFRASIEQVGNKLKNTAMKEGMRALCIPTYPLEIAFKAVELGDVTLSYGDTHNLPMIKMEREWNETVPKKLCEALNMMETYGWKANEKLQNYLDLLGAKARLAKTGKFPTPMEWTNELVTMFGDSFDIGNVHLLDSDGELITELVASPGWSRPSAAKDAYAKLVRWLPKSFPMPTGVGRALSDVATLSVMAINPQLHAEIPDGVQDSDGKWTHPKYNNIRDTPHMYEAVIGAMNAMISYLTTGGPKPPMIPDAICEDGEFDDVLATNLLIALRHKAGLNPPKIYTQVKTNDPYLTNYEPRGEVISCENIESNMDKRYPNVVKKSLCF